MLRGLEIEQKGEGEVSCSAREAGCIVPGARCTMQDARCEVQEAGLAEVDGIRMRMMVDVGELEVG
ncbi:MAG TPA: hypothetical protein VFZ76_16890 [Anaerolineales bacterium]